MTYQEIISQVASKLGHTGFSTELKANYRYAIMFAEQELFQYSNILKRDEILSINSNQEDYELPYDYNEPCEFVFKDATGNILSSINVGRTEFMRQQEIKPDTLLAPDSDILYAEKEKGSLQNDMKYDKRIVFSVDFQDGFYKLYVRPKVNATVNLYYSAMPTQNLYQNLNRVPVLPEQYHQIIIYGAVSYLADIDSANALKNQDYASANFYRKLASDMTEKFNKGKNDTSANSARQPRPSVVKGFYWYDSPLKYR